MPVSGRCERSADILGLAERGIQRRHGSACEPAGVPGPVTIRIQKSPAERIRAGADFSNASICSTPSSLAFPRARQRISTPQASAASRIGVGGLRGCRHPAAGSGRNGDGRLHWYLLARLRRYPVVPAESGCDWHAHQRRCSQRHRRQPRFLSLRLSRSQRDDQYGVLVRAHRRSFCLPEPSRRRMHYRRRGRCTASSDT